MANQARHASEITRNYLNAFSTDNGDRHGDLSSFIRGGFVAFFFCFITNGRGC